MFNEHKQLCDAAYDALIGKRDDVYPCREDVPADLWGKPIPPKSERKKMSNPIYDSIWNPWDKAYKNIKLNVTYNMKVKNYDVQSQDSESTRTNDRDNKSEEILRNSRGE
jgi:hypothetical protein|tara:strand:+ start:1359 stop:1688 length:330 start_codon:yes stop_codon:yes gene_type:complete